MEDIEREDLTYAELAAQCLPVDQRNYVSVSRQKAWRESAEGKVYDTTTVNYGFTNPCGEGMGGETGYIYNKEFHLLNRNIKRLADMVDPEGAAQQLELNAESTKRALSTATETLQQCDVALEVSKSAAPVLAELKRINDSFAGKLELIDQRLLAIEKKTSSIVS